MTDSAPSRSAPNGAGLLDRTAPREVLRRRLELRRWPSVVLLSLLSMVLLGVSFAPFDCWLLAYVALVPWALAMAGGLKPVRTLLIGWACGAVFWAAMLYWLMLPTVAGYLAGVFYLSLYWLVGSLLVRRAMLRNWPMWIVLPVLWVGLEFLRARLIAFPWFFLAQTQYARTGLIQIADTTGQYGVSFFVAMVNGAGIDLLSSPLFVSVRGKVRLAWHIFCGLLVVSLCLIGLQLYGYWRLAQRDRVTAPGPAVGVVQEMFPISLYGRVTPGEAFLDAHLQRSLDLLGEPLDVAVWPETMLPPGMNRELLTADLRALEDRQLRSVAALLFGRDAAERYETAIVRANLLRVIGDEPPERYRVAATRYVLGRFLQPAQFVQLSDAQILALAGRLGLSADGSQRSPDSLRAAVGCFVPGVLAMLDERSLRDAAGVLDTQLPQGADTVAMRTAISRIVPTRYPAVAELLGTRRCQAQMIATCSVLLDCPLLVGGTSIAPNDRPTTDWDLWMFENRALLFTPDGVASDAYAKVHLVPFSEYVPWKYSWPWLHRTLRRAVPGKMAQLNPGVAWSRFALQSGGQNWQLATPICYEGTIGRVVRHMVASGPKDRLVLVNLSNDGWFVHPAGLGGFFGAVAGRPDQTRLYQGSTEHAQHLVHSVFRAVEHRVPVVRAVNTGISAMIDSAGRIQQVLELRAPDVRKRTMAAGTLLGLQVTDARRTFYTRFGDLFAGSVAVLGGILAVVLVWKKATT